MQSKFLGFHNYLMDLGKSVPDMKDELKGHITRAGWRVITDTYDAGPNVCTLDVIPPATEGVGNAVGRDVTRFVFYGDKIRVFPAFQTFKQRARVIDISVNTNLYGTQSAFYPHLSVGGVEVIGVCPDGNRYYGAADARDALYAALLAQPAAIQGWVVTLPYNGGEAFMRFTEPTFGAGGALLAGNKTTVRDVVNDSAPGTVTAPPFGYTDLLVDLAGGWVYFLSILSRSIVLASLTNTATSGPVFASYTDHNAALASTPDGCFPVELLAGSIAGNVGNDRVMRPGLTRNSGVTMRFAHTYAFTKSGGHGNGPDNNYYQRSALTPGATATMSSRQPIDVFLAADYQDAFQESFCLVGPSVYRFYTDTCSGTLTTPTLYGTIYGSDATISPFVPGYSFPDVQANLSAVQNFTLVLATRESDARTLAAAIGAADVALTLLDGSNLPPKGAVTLRSEIIEYDTVAGNTLSGLTRGRYGTTAQAYAAGQDVVPGDWVMRIGNMMMPCGPVKPNGS